METPLVILLWTTLAAAAIGLAATAVIAVRRDGRACLLLLPLGGVAVHQAMLVPELRRGPLGLDVASLQAISMLLVVVGSFAALLAFARVARERNAAEELHWDAMQALHAVNELTLDALPEDRLGELLAIGARHFDMGFAAVLPGDSSEPRAVHASDPAVDVLAVVTALRGYADRSSERPFLDESPQTGPDAPLARVFAAGLYQGDRAVGQLAYASLVPGGRTLTATDKDLLALLAHHTALTIESPGSPVAEAVEPVETVEPVEPTPLIPIEDAPTVASLPRPLPPPPLPPAPVMAPDPPRPAPSLADRLRTGLGDPSVALALGPELDRTDAPVLPLEDVVQDLVAGARAVSKTGALRVESGSTRSPQGDAHFLTLTVHIADPALDAHTLDGASSRGSATIESLGTRLRGPGGDVSISVEAGVGASMTAYVPLGERAGDTPPRRPHSQFAS